MDLKKFKMISAILLAVALLFLSVIMIINKNRYDNLPYSAAEDLSTLLASCGVTLSPDSIPLKREKLPVYSLPAIDGVEAQNIAEILANSTRVAANLTEDGFRFRLENGAMADVSRYLNVSYSLNGTNDDYSVAYPPTDAARAKADAFISLFYSASANEDTLLCDYVLAEYASMGSNTLLKFDMYLNGIKIHGGSLAVYQNASGDILNAQGSCAFSALKKENGYRHYGIINILKAEFDHIKESGIIGDEIESIETYYVMRRSANGENILFLPAWEIKYTNGETRLYDGVYNEAP